MADVEAQLEANGLPTQFESTSNQPEVSHAAANVTATISNAEISQVKQQAPALEVNTISKPVQPVEPTPQQPPDPAPLKNDVSLQQNGDAAQVLDNASVNGNSGKNTNSINSASDLTLDNSSLSNSLSLAPQSSNPVIEMSTITEPLTQHDPMPDQAPISDLRTAPHSDALSDEAVANVEAAKHEMDNNADSEPSTAALRQPELPLSPTEKETGLRTPQSPPPVSELVPTTTVEPQNGAIVPSVESVDATVSGENPSDPAPTPAVPAGEPQDQEMTDVPSQPVKHERDEDTSDEPLAKRMKTEDEAAPVQESNFKVPASPAPLNSGPMPTEPTGPDDVVTPARLQHMKKVISNLKKSNASQAFRIPVDPVALKIPTYPDVIKKPMDLSKIDNRLKLNQYASVVAFKNDFNQIVQNAVDFNGPDHTVTQAGRKMESSFINQMTQLPAAALAEPKVEKKAIKPKIEPVRSPAPRRQSVTGKAASPAASPATFAPDPNGMPLIRRDSALDRPKRAIVPTKRSSDFGSARPKKKKYELEMRFCDEVLKIISSPKHWAANQYFTHPVDPVALNIPTYFQVVKKPMDLHTIRQKLDAAMYERAKDFEDDVRLIFKNCYKFNPEGDYVYQRGQELERLFEQEFSKKQDWIAAREPDSEPASVGGDDDDEESEEEPDAESDEDDQSNQLTSLQKQLEAIRGQMAQLEKSKKKKASPGVSQKKDKKKDKKQQPSAKFPGLQPQKDKSKKPHGKKAKPEKERYVTFAEKQYISNGIAMLPERPMAEALKIIQSSVPTLSNSEQGEIELDIEEVPNSALLKLLSFVKKYAGPPPVEARDDTYAGAAAPSKPKKVKTMSKHEQDLHIAELKGTLGHYEAGSPDALQSVETGAEDSDEDSDNESEEE
ncbi:transcription initiation at TATA-containing promoter protein [Lithohypha guttulata]|nr:transcription initiation at TATA-containing promoter protein [Lithohypha guttulata]